MSLLLIHIFFICINIGLFTVQTATSTDLGAIPYPDSMSNESTGTLSQITNPSNSTDGTPFDFITETAFQGSRAIQIMIDAITGGFIFNVISSSIIPLPEQFVIGVKILIGFLLAIQIFYFFTGRSSTHLT